MVDIRRIDVEQHHFLGCSLYLKDVPLHFLIFTKGFLCGQQFSIDQLNQKHSVICMMEKSNSVEDLLESVVMACSLQAQLAGIVCGMKGKEVLTLLHEEKS